MKRSVDRILTTHTGSLIRPPQLLELVKARQAGQAIDESAYEATLKDSVRDVVARQVEAGIDIPNDGEFGKSTSWSLYARDEHEWKVWQEVKLPAGKILVPGVVSHSTNVVEHPELIAERLTRFASCVSRENLIAGTDCGLAQEEINRRVHHRSCGRSLKRWP